MTTQASDLIEYPVNIAPIDITPYATGNTGIPYVTTFDSGLPGPHVVVNALTHGNELCGAHALAFLFENGVRPLRGRLSLSFANVAAYHTFDAANPTESRYVDEDFNRLWSSDVLDGPRISRERARARELRPLIDDADYLLDIHSMQSDCQPLLLSGTLAKGVALARGVGYPQHVVADVGHRAGTRMRDYGDFSNLDSPKASLLVECGQHWDPASVTVAKETTLRFLDYFDVIDREFVTSHLHDKAADQKFIEVTQPVTVKDANFHFVERFTGLEVIPEAGTVIGMDGDDPVRTPYDSCVLIMPSRRLQRGQTAVRLGRFVA
jgi:predicted deacylase